MYEELIAMQRQTMPVHHALTFKDESKKLPYYIHAATILHRASPYNLPPLQYTNKHAKSRL